MYVAPPGSLKSTILKNCLEVYPDAMVLSDLNAQTINPLRDEFASGRYKTMAFPAFEKLYERDPRTAANCIGILKAMACEGYSEASFEDHRMQGVFEARAFIAGAMIPELYRRKYAEWVSSGFARRFLWSFYKFADANIIIKAIHEWRRIEFNMDIAVRPMEYIKFDVSDKESGMLLKLTRYQPAQEAPFVLLKKVLSVLKWRYPRDKSRPMEIINDFALSMQKRPDDLIVDLPTIERKEVELIENNHHKRERPKVRMRARSAKID
jgi:hypothetical protein